MGGHGYSSLSVCLFVCYFQPAHLAAIALRLQHGHNKLLLLKVADCDVKASLSNKSEQKLTFTLTAS